MALHSSNRLGRSAGSVALTLALLIPSHACGGPAGPDAEARLVGDDVAVFALHSVGGDALPAIAVDNGHVRITILADTIRLRADGIAERHVVERMLSITGLPRGEKVRTSTQRFTYRTEGERFAGEFGCPDFASCVAPPHFTGTLEPGALTLDHALYYRVPLVYARIAQ